MAKKAILEVLESTIGRYVRNLDPTTLNVAVWSGQIQLSSLSLDVDAVNAELGRRAREAPNLASPFRVTEGRFENVSLDVPWARLTSRPVVFRARGLWVGMEPFDFLKDEHNDCDGSAAGKTKDERSNSVATEERRRKRTNLVKMALEEEEEEDDKKGSSTFTSRLVRRIVENLQFEIEDVHVSVTGCGVAAGLVLGSLSLVTTDANGVRTFVDRQTNAKDPASSFLYKELLISGLGIYLQRDHEMQMQQQKRMEMSPHTEYVLSPLSFQAKLRQSDLANCVDFPKYLVHSKLSSLSIGLSRTQLELGHRLAMAVKPQHGVRPLFPEYRPLVSVKSDPKKWWKYATRCIGRLNRRRSWIEFYSAFQKRKVYVELYKRFAHAEGASWLSPLGPLEILELEEIERDRSISIGGLMHWRNLADGQVEREREKMLAQQEKRSSAMGSSGTTPKARTRYSLFGSTPKKEALKRESTTETEFYECLDDENDAPITLSADEMKELEELAMKKADQTLTSDSMFCDVNFTLGSFQVSLTTASNLPITSFEMDMVSTSFKAKADGSFAFGLSLLSLEVLDSVTAGTFYPTICRSLQKSQTKQSHAFQLQLKKSKGGDQELVLKMVACEIVASPLLLFAVVEFFKLPVATTNVSAANPMLLETVSGEEDMFFDAREGESTVLLSSPIRASTTAPAISPVHPTMPSSKDGKVSDKVSSAIYDAWNGKNQNKQHWTMDFDISAPILILPEDCVNPNAAVLICNFGKFNFTYGSDALSHSVVEWFDARQRANKMDSEIDHLKLEMNDLSFTISSVGDASKKGLEGLNRDVSTSVISPVSFTLDIGLEHTISSGDNTPRTCVIGVLPAIIMRAAPSHVTKVLRVAGIWSSNLHKLRGESQVTTDKSLGDVEEESDLEIMSSGSGISLLDADYSKENEGKKALLSKKDKMESMLKETNVVDSSVASEFMHISLSLLRLSLNIYTESGDGVEAHLVSVKVSTSLSTDGSSSTRLCMGWFWILDRLESELGLPRRQRLVCHSNLPQAADIYAENEQYTAIMDDLTKQGVFVSNYSGSSDLADIQINKLPSSKVKEYHDNLTGFSREYINYIWEVEEVTVINAKFTSLFINWNPHAIKSLFAAKDHLLDFKQKAYSTYEDISSTRHVDPKASTLLASGDDMLTDPSDETSTFIFAEMDTFEIALNSAKDDLPLFTLTMCDSKVTRHQANEFNSEMDLVVGDLRIETPALGRTLDSYRTILGLSPSVATSLLSLKYCKGSSAVSSCNVGNADKQECEACAVISLSPMRFVHLHSQVFTLIDYVSDGVFGAMAASVASTAAAAAREAVKSSQNGERLFYIVASGFDFVLPRAAYSENYFVFNTGELEAHYRTLENETGSTAQLSLRDLSLSCDQEMPMVSTPVNLSVSVKMKPPLYNGTEDEKATRVDMSTTRIQILLAQCHYVQIMHILDFNIGEPNNFLRSDLSITRSYSATSAKEEKTTPATESTVDSILKNLTHAGVQSIDVVKRMYINMNIQELSLELCGVDTDDPIVSIAAVDAQVMMKLLPDQKQTKAYMTLHDLVCDDRRIGAHDRTFRRMIGRAGVGRHHHSVSPGTETENEDVFQVNYTKNTEDQSRLIEVKLGSSQVVVLPDVITDMLNFINVPATLSPSRAMNSRTSSKLSSQQSDGEMNVLVADDDPEAVEACYGERASVALKTTNYRVDSSNMRLVLVDLGSMDASGSFVTSKPTSTLTETIVLQGKMQASFDMTTDTLGGTTVEKDYKIDAQRVEVYTAQGADLLHPIQLLEPAKFSIFYYQNVGYNRSQHMTDFKFVTLTPIDMTISMQNIALCSALATSISDSFGTSDEGESEDSEFHSLSPTDAKRISHLDSILVKDSDQSTQSASEHKTDISVHSGREPFNKRRIIKIKMTSPEATFTVTNDFQGLDEALFKLVAMNFVLGGEIDYPTGSQLEKPLFGFNTNTSILADYFDAASARWETLLTDPWELTFNGSRAPQSRFDTNRMSTTFDIESNPCNVSFSEHFLVNVGAASRMWSVYSGATKKATSLVEEGGKTDAAKRRLSRSMAAHAARSLITTLPYAIENHSGINAHYSIYRDPVRIPLPTSSTQFFQFELFPGRGSGGLRRYGQDIKHSKSLVIYVGSTEIAISDMDREINKPRSAHYVSEFRTHIFTNVVKRGNSTVLHISSHVEIFNCTSLPFRISLIDDDSVHDLGVVQMARDKHSTGSHKNQSLLHENEELMTHSVFGLPAQFLRSFMIDNSETLCVQVSPVLEGEESSDLVGLFNIPQLEQLVEVATSDSDQQIIEVSCHTVSHRASQHPSLTANVCINVSLVDDAHPFVQLSITPRLILTNKLPVDIMLRTPMPHTFAKRESSQSSTSDYRIIDKNFATHEMKPLGSVEVFTPGPSIAISMSCADLPIAGAATDWMDGGWLDVPLGSGKKLSEPVQLIFPFKTESIIKYSSSRELSGRSVGFGKGSEFFALEADDVTPDLKETGERTFVKPKHSIRSVFVVVCNYAVDHTGNLLFEEVATTDDKRMRPDSAKRAPPFSAFSSTKLRRRVSLLPGSMRYIRLVELTMDGDEGMKRSMPFRVDDVSMTEGIDSMPILWANNTPSGYFAYRNLTAEGSEIHVVPEFVVFNGSQHHQIWVKQLSRTPFLLDPHKISPISRDKNNSIVVQFDIPSINGLTGPVQIDQVGLRVVLAKSKKTGEPLGSLAVQTVTGAKDSRLVIKIGALNFRDSQVAQTTSGLFEQDFLRFRVRWSEMKVTLKDTEEDHKKYEENRTAIRKYLEHHNVNSVEVEKRLAEARREYNQTVHESRTSFPDVAQIIFHRFTVDFQRIFKEDERKSHGIDLPSNERSQFSIVIHNVRIKDCSPNTQAPNVFDSVSDKSFFDLCVRTRGPLNADLIRVDLFDLNLAYGDGKAERIIVNTGEDFVWRLLDIANRTMLATAELAGVDLDLSWNEETGKFSVSISDPVSDDLDSDGNYQPPRSDKLYDVKKLRVSPFLLLLSFKRQPQSSRYAIIRGVRGAKLTNYFTTRLKFTIDRAELPFQGYMVRDIKGPPDRLADTIKTVYVTQLKTKMVTLMTATSIQDWKYLTARESGGEEFIEGDLLRMTGNLAGRSAKFVLKKSGDFLGESVMAVTGTIGGGIQDVSETIGVGAVGAGVNSFVSGVGEGVSSTVKGVGVGAGDIVRGAGKGIGQVIGGIGGGAQLVAKGLGRGITTGDMSGVGEGFASMGSGIGQGVETAVEGTVSGVWSVGKGVFSGVKSVGKGIGGVFTGGQERESERKSRGSQHKR